MGQSHSEESPVANLSHGHQHQHQQHQEQHNRKQHHRKSIFLPRKHKEKRKSVSVDSLSLQLQQYRQPLTFSVNYNVIIIYSDTATEGSWGIPLRFVAEGSTFKRILAQPTFELAGTNGGKLIKLLREFDCFPTNFITFLERCVQYHQPTEGTEQNISMSDLVVDESIATTNTLNSFRIRKIRLSLPRTEYEINFFNGFKLNCIDIKYDHFATGKNKESITGKLVHDHLPPLTVKLTGFSLIDGLRFQFNVKTTNYTANNSKLLNAAANDMIMTSLPDINFEFLDVPSSIFNQLSAFVAMMPFVMNFQFKLDEQLVSALTSDCEEQKQKSNCCSQWSVVKGSLRRIDFFLPSLLSMTSSAVGSLSCKTVYWMGSTILKCRELEMSVAIDLMPKLSIGKCSLFMYIPSIQHHILLQGSGSACKPEEELGKSSSMYFDNVDQFLNSFGVMLDRTASIALQPEFLEMLKTRRCYLTMMRFDIMSMELRVRGCIEEESMPENTTQGESQQTEVTFDLDVRYSSCGSTVRRRTLFSTSIVKEVPIHFSENPGDVEFQLSLLNSQKVQDSKFLDIVVRTVNERYVEPTAITITKEATVSAPKQQPHHHHHHHKPKEKRQRRFEELPLLSAIPTHQRSSSLPSEVGIEISSISIQVPQA